MKWHLNWESCNIAAESVEQARSLWFNGRLPIGNFDKYVMKTEPDEIKDTPCVIYTGI